MNEEQPDRLDLVEKDINTSHTYAPEEIAFITGYSIGLVHKLIDSGTLYAHEHTGKVRISGSSVLQYVKYHRDALEMYSQYSQRRQRQRASKASKVKGGVRPTRKTLGMLANGEPVVSKSGRTFRPLRKSAAV